MPARDQHAWAELLRRTAAAAGPLARLPPRSAPEPEKQAFIAAFRDDLGHRRPVDRPLLARLLAADPGPPPDRADPELLLWRGVHDPAIDPRPILAPDGPLLGLDMDLGIEPWTEAEFAALHALSWLARDPRRPDRARLAARLDAAAAWHLAETQPDNGTNHPWAIHLFAARAQHDPEAAVYAETMLHACLAARARPDAFSALLMLDAADALSPAG